jgi:hypothetical protein
MAINYKTLFEVKLLHEFYLTKKDGTTVFSVSDQPNRLKFLLDEYTVGRESINADISFEFPARTAQVYDAHQLKLLPTYSGFRVLARVDVIRLSDNSIVYRPVVPIEEGLSINILMVKKNTAIEGYTNARLHNALPAIYYFSNETVRDVKVFPFLTNAIASFNSNYSYEQGELVSFGSGDIRGFYQDTSGDQWNSFIGSAYANESDRLLLPLKFYYSFGGITGIKDAEFILKDKNGTVVKSIAFHDEDEMQKVFLDFSDKSDQLDVSETEFSSNSVYSIEVSGSNGFLRNHSAIFGNAFYNTGIWGMISIKPVPSVSAFRLFSPEGYLLKKIDPDGSPVSHPTYEIPVKGRFVYWRFRNEKGEKLDHNPTLDGYLDLQDGTYTSVRPHTITRSYFSIKKEGSALTKYLPNPVNYDLVKINEKLCFEIRVPKSSLFPVVP